MTAILEGALGLARQGYRVFPVNGKRPWPGFKWREGATSDPDRLRELWERWPTSNVAIATGEQSDGSHLVVVDVDGPSAEGVLDTYAADTGVPMPSDCIVHTARGRHIYLRSDRPMRNATRLDGSPLDIRATGGYVVAPPSMHDSGTRYAWDGEPALAGEAPGWLSRMRSASRVSAGETIADKIMEGGRDDYLTSYAGRMRHFGASAEEIEAALTQANQGRCLPPLSAADVSRISHSVARYAASAEIPTEPAACLTWQDIAQPLAPKEWICRDLGIARGRPYLISGYSGVGKTWFAMELLLACCAGTRGTFWGGAQLDACGPCVHLDYEMGADDCRERYQQLAAGWGHDVDPELRLYPSPRVRMTDPDSVEVLTRMTEGAVLCLVDNLRAACPGVDENDSRIAEYIYRLNQVTQATGCLFVLIHHENKPSPGKRVGAAHRIRGSSAIHGALGGAISLGTPDDGGWLQGDCAKSAHSRPHLPLELALVESPDPNPITGNPRALRVDSKGLRFERRDLGREASCWAAVSLALESGRPLLAVARSLGLAPGHVDAMAGALKKYYSAPPMGAGENCNTVALSDYIMITRG